MKGFICLIYDRRSGLCNIGFSQDPKQRLAEKKRRTDISSVPHDFYLVDVFPGYKGMVTRLHGIFDAVAVHGEWFQFTLREYAEFRVHVSNFLINSRLVEPPDVDVAVAPVPAPEWSDELERMEEMMAEFDAKLERNWGPKK